MKDETIAIHAGYESEPTTKSVAVPIYQTVAYEFESAKHGADLFNLEVAGNIYTRIMNPTSDVLEKRMAELEGGIAGLALSAGSAAINYAILTIAKAGSNVVSVPQLYGGTYTLFAHMLPGLGVEVRFAEDDQPASLERLIDGKTAAVFLETMGNPAGNVADIEAITAMAHSHGVPVIADATVTPPVITKSIAVRRGHRRPLDDQVHRRPRQLAGRHDRRRRHVPLGRARRQVPHAHRAGAGLPRRRLHGGLRPGRLHRPCRGPCRCATPARRSARSTPSSSSRASRPWPCAWSGTPPTPRPSRSTCKGHERVSWVSYAGLPDSPYYELAQKYTGGRPSGLVSFGIEGGYEPGQRFYDALKLFKRLVNIGDVRSLAAHPASTTHRQMTEAEQATAKVTPDLIRLSVGIEHIDDILEDLDQALAASAG